MKQFVVFSIFMSFAAAKSLSRHEEIKFEGREKVAMAECARELGVDEKKYDHAISLDDYEKNPTEETTCMMACGFRKLMIEEVTGANNKETLFNGFSKLIADDYEAGFHSSKFTREDAVNKVENCNAKAQNECKFFKCLEFVTSEFFELILYNLIHFDKGSIFGSHA